jgi:two-component system, NarL family, response regulator NreC
MPKTERIRVLIADDHAILRAGLRMLINAQPDMTVLAEAQDGRDAIRKAQEASPDVVILDITMPNLGGLNAISEIVKISNTIRVLLLSMHEEPAYVRTALTAGASGYVLKKSVDADLLSAIRAVHKGGTYVDSELANSLVRYAFPEQRLSKTGTDQSKSLSERELEVLKLVAEGFSSREIAERIYVSTKTVETYRGRFAEKLGLRSRADVVRYALDMGLLSSEKFTTRKQRSRDIKRLSPPRRSS